MDQEKAIEILREIIAKTKARKLPWKDTAQEGVFVAPMKGQYTLKAFPFTDYENSKASGPPSVTLFEGDNMVLDITFGLTGISPTAFSNLYEDIRSQVYRTDEKVSDALDFLKSL